MAERKYAIRFSAEDMDKVRTALKGMGDDGVGALRAIERQSRQVTPAMKAVDTAAKEVRNTFEDFANRIPVIGGALSALGPIGTTVAAGFVAVGLALNAGFRNSRQAVDDLGALKDAADDVALSVRDLQAVRGVTLLEGISTESIDGMLATLARGSAAASEGYGKMHAALQRVNPELAQQLAMSSTQAERLDILARATQQATTYNEKLNIAVAAFGPEGRQMIRVLDESGASLDAWAARAQAAGLIIDTALVESVDQMGKRMDILQAQADVAGKRLAVSIAPMLESIQKMQTNFMLGAAELADGANPIEKRQLYTLVVQYNRVRERIADDGDFLDIRKNEMKALEAEINKRLDQAADDQATAAAQAARDKAQADVEAFGEWLDQWYIDHQKESREAAAEAAKEAERAAVEAARIRAAQEKEAIEIRAGLGDWTGKLAAEEARLNALVAAGALSRETANAHLAKYRAELDGSTATLERWRSAMQSTETPVERARRELAAFVAEAMTITDRGPAFQAALRYYSGALEDAEKAAREATPAFQAVAAARALITKEAERLLSINEKVAAYTAQQNKLIGVNGYSWEEAAKAVQAYRAELEQTAEAQRNSTFEIRFAAETLGAILDDDMNSLEDLGRIAAKVFRNMAIEWILANQKMAATQSIGQFIGNAIGSGFGMSFGGGVYVDPAMAAYPGLVNPDPSIGAAYGIQHAGGVIGANPVQSRWARSDIFVGAPRMHRGGELRPGERPIIAEDGERMLSRVDNARVVRAIENGAGASPKVELHFHGVSGARPEVREGATADGGKRIDVFFREQLQGAVGSGALDKAMAERFGVKRGVRQ